MVDFILNHNDKTEEVTLPYGGKDIISGKTYTIGENASLAAKDVMILHSM